MTILEERMLIKEMKQRYSDSSKLDTQVFWDIQKLISHLETRLDKQQILQNNFGRSVEQLKMLHEATKED